jgi:hypothetical protein
VRTADSAVPRAAACGGFSKTAFCGVRLAVTKVYGLDSAATSHHPRLQIRGVCRVYIVDTFARPHIRKISFFWQTADCIS